MWYFGPAALLYRNACDDFNLEIETAEPVHTDRSPVRIRRLGENFAFHLHHESKLLFGIGVKCCHIDDVVETAPSRLQRRLEISERQAHLRFEVGFGRTVAATTDLAGHEEKVTRLDRRGIGLFYVKVMLTGRKNGGTLTHDVDSPVMIITRYKHERRRPSITAWANCSDGPNDAPPGCGCSASLDDQ